MRERKWTAARGAWLAQLWWLPAEWNLGAGLRAGRACVGVFVRLGPLWLDAGRWPGLGRWTNRPNADVSLEREAPLVSIRDHLLKSAPCYCRGRPGCTCWCHGIEEVP